MQENPQFERQKVYDYCRTMLGDQMIDVELDPIHYETALNRALNKFRQRSPNSVEESYMFLTLEPNTNDYKLPEEIVNVQSVYRKAMGSKGGSGTGTYFEPFNSAYMNTYMLNSTNMGGLTTYFLFASYQKMVGKMFGSFIEFQWIQYSRTLRVLQKSVAEGEVIMLRCQNHRPDFVLLNDLYAKQWFLDYSLASCKLMLGEARSKFSTYAGPQGGSQLNGDALKQAATAEIEKLEKEISDLIPGGTPMTFIIG